MKIVQLDIQGFRSLKNVSWRPGDLNVVIGPNGSGKSNLLRMLEMILVATQGRLREYIRSTGGINAIAWDGQAKDIKFLLTCSGTEYGVVPNGFLYQIDLEKVPLQNDYAIQREVLEDIRDSFKVIDSDGLNAKVQGRKSSQHAQGGATNKESVFSSAGTPFVPWMATIGLPFYKQQIEE